MIQRLSNLTALLILALFSLSFSWPLNEGRITSTFGESRGDHFHDGVDMVSTDSEIHPVRSGELLYVWDQELFPYDTSPGGGSYRVVSHGDGYYSVYMHLQHGYPLQSIYHTKDVVGLIGNSGHSFAAHLHFSVMKFSENQSINPFALFSPWKDEKAPEIRSTGLRIGKKIVTIRDGSSIRLTQQYPLLIKIVDQINGGERLGIYHLQVWHNGKKVTDVSFKDIVFSKNGLTVKGMPFQSVFDEEGFYRVDGFLWTEGENQFKVKAFDYAGNQLSQDLLFKVTLDTKKLM